MRLLPALLVLATSSTALACPVPMEATPLDRAGKAGFWVTAEGLACMSAELEQKRAEADALRSVADLQTSRVETLESYLRSEGELYKRTRELLEDARDDMEPSLIDSPVLWFGVGVVATSLAAWGLSEVAR